MAVAKGNAGSRVSLDSAAVGAHKSVEIEHDIEMWTLPPSNHSVKQGQ